jgi:hypothetical protein
VEVGLDREGTTHLNLVGGMIVDIYDIFHLMSSVHVTGVDRGLVAIRPSTYTQNELVYQD